MKIKTGLLEFDFPDKFAYAIGEGKFKKALLRMERKALKLQIKDLEEQLKKINSDLSKRSNH